MGVRILNDRDNGVACLYCSTSGVAFGPVFDGDNDASLDADECAEAFLRWLPTEQHNYEMHPIASGRDVRSLTDAGLERAHSAWLAQKDAQFKREGACEHADPCTPRTVDICESCETAFAMVKS